MDKKDHPPLEEIREAFKVFDRDGNGFISKQELGTAMRSLGYMPNEVELEVIIQRLDMDELLMNQVMSTQLLTQNSCLDNRLILWNIMESNSNSDIIIFYAKLFSSIKDKLLGRDMPSSFEDLNSIAIMGIYILKKVKGKY
ncbi:unnamed protein product [Ranitomeya imitator]|uniref:EF-hand domain-containing protein n=1 Tax=Ranitomeya imitator TaxID=111125 RepID=A0ABN9LY81_9NEOB|nr:unnamed protein product [Ranitomeya imitator]